MEIRPATPADADVVYDLLAARSRAVFGVAGVERAEVEAQLARAETDCFLAEGGYAHVHAGHGIVIAATDPVVGDALLARAEERARERGFGSVDITAVSEDEPLWSLAERNGYRPEREIFRMWCTLRGKLPAPQWPDGTALRTYADDDAESVHRLLDEAYAGWNEDYVPRAHDSWVELMTQHGEFDPAMWFLVERDGDLVACNLCWREHRKQGWVKDLVVREDQRGTGLGKALLLHAFREYAARGVDRVGLKMESTNPTAARALYERVGFATDRIYTVWVKEL